MGVGEGKRVEKIKGEADARLIGKRVKILLAVSTDGLGSAVEGVVKEMGRYWVVVETSEASLVLNKAWIVGFMIKDKA